MRRLEDVVSAAQAIEEVMRGESRWNAAIVSDRLLSKGYVIRLIRSEDSPLDPSDPGRIDSELAISGAWPLPREPKA